MPLTRKLISVGNSKAIVVPASWLKNQEELSGCPIREILMEVDGVLTISPKILKKKGGKRTGDDRK